MNRIKTGAVVLGVALVAAVVAVMPTSNPQPAQADPINVIGLNSAICVTLGVAFGGLGTVDAVNNCGSITQQANPGMQGYVGCLRGVDQDRDLVPGDPIDQPLLDQGYPDPIPQDGVKACFEGVEADDEDTGLLLPEPEDFAALDLDQNQIHVGQSLYVMAFVNDDASVRFTTDEGKFLTPGGPTSNFICNTAAYDPDCDGDDATPGDGVVVASLTVDETVEPGAYEGIVVQEGIGFPFTYNVVGPPDDISLSILFAKPSMQVGGTPPPPSTIPNPDDPVPNDDIGQTLPGPDPEPTDCTADLSVNGVLGANSDPRRMIIIAKALDEDGNEVVGALIDWDKTWGGDDDTSDYTSESDVANVVIPSSPTLDTGALGIGFPQFVCSSSETGTETFNVKFQTTLSGSSRPNETASIEVTVVDEPANIVLAVNPPTLACDGTASAAVTATITTADGDPVANGTDVDWSVQVLGTVSPTAGETAGGTATANVVPLAGTNVGVPVIATVGDLQASALVQCGAGSAPTTPGETPPPGGGAGAGGRPPTGTVRPPDTGTGGDLDGRAALNVWGAVALFAGAMGLVGARVALRKV